MGICSVRTLFFGTLLVFGFAYYIYPKFPPEATNHHAKAMFGLLFRSSVVMGNIGTYFGFGSPLNISRAILERSAKFEGRDTVEVTESKMDGVRVLIIRPKFSTGEKLPGLLYFHGGGWAYLSPDGYLKTCTYLSQVTNSVVVSVDYRLAPEHLFPAAIEDAIRVTRYLLKNGAEVGVDPTRIGISGDSAGGNLAMATSLNMSLADYYGLPPLRFQMLIYPALQMFDLNLPSYITHGDGPGFMRKDPMIDFYLTYLFGDTTLRDIVYVNKHTSKALKKSKFASYVSQDLLPERFRSDARPKLVDDCGDEEILAKIEEKMLNPMFAPLMATDEQLTKMPPAYILLAEFDVLRDDGFLAAARLEQAGIPVTVDYLPTEEHHLISAPEQPEVAEAFRKFAEYFNKRMK